MKPKPKIKCCVKSFGGNPFGIELPVERKTIEAGLMDEDSPITFHCVGCKRAMCADISLVGRTVTCNHCGSRFTLTQFTSASSGRAISFKVSESPNLRPLGLSFGRTIWEAARTAYKQPGFSSKFGLKKKFLVFKEVKDPLFLELLHMEFFVVFKGIQQSNVSADKKQEIAVGASDYLIDRAHEGQVEMESFVAMHKQRLTQYESITLMLRANSGEHVERQAVEKLCDMLQGVLKHTEASTRYTHGIMLLLYFLQRYEDGIPLITFEIHKVCQ